MEWKQSSKKIGKKLRRLRRDLVMTGKSRTTFSFSLEKICIFHFSIHNLGSCVKVESGTQICSKQVVNDLFIICSLGVRIIIKVFETFNVILNLTLAGLIQGFCLLSYLLVI